MGYSYPSKPQNKILQGVKQESDDLFMQEDNAARYVHGQPYVNSLTYEIVIL